MQIDTVYVLTTQAKEIIAQAFMEIWHNVNLQENLHVWTLNELLFYILIADNSIAPRTELPSS